jgi:glycosyltransferase involved in cell wall biosynthesis
MISVIMPAHNEQGYLEPAVKAVVSGLAGRPLDFEVVVAENGSTDATHADAEELARTYPEVKVLHWPVADYGLALRHGFLAAAGEVVVNFDVDLVDIGFLERALDALDDSSVAVVIGSKRAAGANDERRLARRVVTAVYSYVLRRGFGLSVSDTHGLKALRREPLLPVVERCRFGGDLFDTELVLRAERLGLKVVEIPVSVADTRPSRTAISRRIVRSLRGLAALRVALWREAGGS